MKSFEPFYALLAAFIPVSVIAAFMSLAVLLLEQFTGPLPVPCWFAVSLVSAVSASVYWGLVKKSKASHAAANIRGAGVMAIAAYCVGSAASQNPAGIAAWFYPSLYNIPASLFSLAVWFPVVAVKQIFSGQELFEANIRLFQGEKLRQKMLEDSSLMSETDQSMKKLSFYYTFSFLPCAILLFVAGGTGSRFSFPLILLLTLIFMLGAAVTGFVFFLRREYAFAAEGLTLPNRPKAITALVFMVFTASGAGLLLSADKSILSPSLIADLFRRIMAWFERLPKPAAELPPPAPPVRMEAQGAGLPRELLELMGDAEPSPFWDYVKYAIIIAAGVLFVWFMINPLLGKSRLWRGAKTWPKKILAFLKTWLKTLTQSAAAFFNFTRDESGRVIKPSSAALKRLEDTILEGYSPAKRRELRRSISLFARLIYFGQEVFHITWKPSHAPIEYCTLLANAAAGVSHNPAAILRAGALFEKALYSVATLLKKEREEFKSLVEIITTQKIS